MKIGVDASALRKTKWYEYAVRFLLGGTITVFAGLIAKKFGPSVGGLFLAFPAIFPASATLVEKHQRQQKEKKGMSGEERGTEAASIDAAGSAMGSIGLLVFALLGWQFLPCRGVSAVLLSATTAWIAVSVCFGKLKTDIGGIAFH